MAWRDPLNYDLPPGQQAVADALNYDLPSEAQATQYAEPRDPSLGPTVAQDIVSGIPAAFGKVPFYVAGAPAYMFGLGMRAGGEIDRRLFGGKETDESIAARNPFASSTPDALMKLYEKGTGVPFYEPKTRTGRTVQNMLTGLGGGALSGPIGALAGAGFGTGATVASEQAQGTPWEIPLEVTMAVMGGLGGKGRGAKPKGPGKVVHPADRPGPKKGDVAKQAADLVTLRGLPVDQAIAIASKQPHLVPRSAKEGGGYVGGPTRLAAETTRMSYNLLKKLRQEVYDYIAKDWRGADWYDRYRAGLAEITGGNPLQALTRSKLQGNMSAGVDPRSELKFTNKQLNAGLAGFPQVKAARPLQQQQFNAAMDAARQGASLDAQMASILGGKKTGEYARQVDPMLEGRYDPLASAPPVERPIGIGHNQGPPLDDIGPATVEAAMPTVPTARGRATPASLGGMVPSRVPGSTGVNDFRFLTTMGFTEPDGGPRKNAVGPASHNWTDHEATLIVDAANKAALGGRTDWTGEQLQAAPWVRQKAEAIAERQNMTYEEAFQEANKTIADFFPETTLSATHEVRPGVGLGYLPDLDKAPTSQISQYNADPRRWWNTAPGKRDALYSGFGIPGSGFYMGVRPSLEMQGIYQPKGMPLELNEGQVARPLVGIENLPGGMKRIAEADQAIINAIETVRGAVDVQRVEAGHMTFTGAPDIRSGSWVIPTGGKLSQQQAAQLNAIAQKHGFPNVVDRGDNVTITDFDTFNPPVLRKQKMDAFLSDVKTVLPNAEPYRAFPDGYYIDLSKEFLAGEGSGQVARAVIKAVTATPEIRAAMENNPYLPQVILNKLAADKSLGMRYGRKDVLELRRIIGSGPGWVDRLEKAIQAGTVASLLGAGVLSLAMADLPRGDSQAG